MKKGVKKISGTSEIKVGEWQTYTVSEWYTDTPINQRIVSQVKWAVYYLNNGVPNKILEKSEGKFRFQEPAIGKTYLIVAYLFEPELSTGLQIKVVSSVEKEITSIVASGNTNNLAYGDTLNVVVQTVAMQNDYLELSLYEDDTEGTGHNSINNKNLLKTKTVRIGNNGVATTQFVLEPDFQRIANAYLARGDNNEGSAHEFYVAVYYLGSLKASSGNVNVANPEHSIVRRDETTQVINGNQTATQGVINDVQLTKNGTNKLLVTINSSGLTNKSIRLKVFEEDLISNDLLVDKNFVIKSDSYKIDVFLDRIPQSLGGDFMAEGNYQELFADVELIDTNAHILSQILNVDISTFKVNVATNNTPTVINSNESLLAAYFAKKEYIEKTTEDAGIYEYTFGGTKANNRTSNQAEKESVANAILTVGKVNDKLKPEKRYTTKEAIVAALTANEYGRDTTNNKKVTFNTFKLGPSYIRINSAPLGEKLYLVAETGSLDGKSVTIKIKEKDGIIKGSANALLSVLEITEAQMETTNTSDQVQGTEKTQFTATVNKSMARVPIHLRPKSNEDLEDWKKKITKGKQDGNYTYTFGNENGTVITAENKARIAGIILENAKGGKLGNPKIAEGKIAYKEDVEKVLEVKTYNKGETINFSTYKKEAEMLWLDVSCSGDKEQHQKDFLKEDGSYFMVGGLSNCSCNRDITESELNIILKKLRGNDDTTIFTDDNCNLDDKSKISFINELNKTLKKYEINTCIRKVHFLAQIYHETARLRTTLEYASGSGYNPSVHDDAISNGNTEPGDGPKFKGRGLMQLTWKNNYKLYKAYSGIDIVTNYAKVSDELEIAVDSAGWYFKQGKKLNNGNTWTVPNTSFSEFDGSTGKQFNKTTYTYDGTTYATVNINLLADKDYIDTISWLINGGGNGRIERRDYLKKLKEIDFFICESNKWHDPVDNPMLCLYSQGGETKKPWHGSFGPTIRDSVNKHTGMDLFAKPGMNIYSCVKGEVVRSEINSSMFGELIVIKVIDEETLKSRRKNPFTLKYSDKSEIESQNFDHNGPFYLVYAHLKERKVAIGDIVDAGKIIGLTGTSGNNGVPFSTKNPHLHFEIMNVEKQAGLDKKCNPGVYLTYKDEDNLTASDIAEQEEARTDSKFWTQ